MKKRLFWDTNIMLDLLGEREPFYKYSAQLATLADQKELAIVVSPISFTTVNYLLSKFETELVVKEKLRKFKILCEICRIDETIVEKALQSNFKDFEDALQYFCAIESQCETIITRDGKDFQNSLLPVMTAEEYIKSKL